MKALEGIRVVDFSRILAGPFATMVLADMGAEVIKVERPEKGDDSRAYGPFVHDESLYFMSVNRGKKSLELNLKNEKARELVLKLIDTSDVVVENFKPGVMKKLGLGYEVLSARNPRLIYCACSGYGQTGPYSCKPAYDMIMQGLSGIMSITGPDGAHPYRVGMSIADVDTGMFAAMGIITALYQREKTGRGQLVDIAMLDCMMSILENAACRTLNTGKAPTAIGNRHVTICPFGSIRARDGYFNIAAGNDALFVKLVDALEVPELAGDARFATNDLRLQHWPELEAALNEAASKRTIAEWCEIIDRAGVPVGPLNTMMEAVSHPQLEARGTVTTIPHPVAGDIRCIGTPLHLSDSERSYTHAPVLGADTAAYIEEILGCSEDEARELAVSFKEQ